MKLDLHTLAYLSRNDKAPDSPNMSSVVDDILVTARKKNLQLDVTGALLFSRGYFAQVLEGPLASVEAVFESIQCDSRHRDVRVLYSRQIAKRDFANWSMAFAGSHDHACLPIEADWNGADQERINADRVGRDLVKILTALIDRQELASAPS